MFKSWILLIPVNNESIVISFVIVIISFVFVYFVLGHIQRELKEQARHNSTSTSSQTNQTVEEQIPT